FRGELNARFGSDEPESTVGCRNAPGFDQVINRFDEFARPIRTNQNFGRVSRIWPPFCTWRPYRIVFTRREGSRNGLFRDYRYSAKEMWAVQTSKHTTTAGSHPFHPGPADGKHQW